MENDSGSQQDGPDSACRGGRRRLFPGKTYLGQKVVAGGIIFSQGSGVLRAVVTHGGSTEQRADGFSLQRCLDDLGGPLPAALQDLRLALGGPALGDRFASQVNHRFLPQEKP